MRKMSELTAADFPGVDEAKFENWRDAAERVERVQPAWLLLVVGVVVMVVFAPSVFQTFGSALSGLVMWVPFLPFFLAFMVVAGPKGWTLQRLQKEAGITREALVKARRNQA